MKKNLIITDYRGFLRRRRFKDESLNIDTINTVLEKGGYNFDVVSFEEIAQNYKYYSQIKDSFIIYAASKSPEYNKYIDHIIYLLGKKNHLIPNYELFKSFDDKGFQELYKTYLGIESLDYLYLSNKMSFEKVQDSIEYPIVMKEMVSASSMGVYKIDNSNGIKKKIEKISSRNKLDNKDLIRSTIKKGVRRKVRDYDGVGRFVLQEFVPNLEEDWKVLIFGEKYYVLNRKVRKNDFRASGSGEFQYTNPPKEVLEMAKEVFLKLSVPFLSLDLAFNGETAYIIELQALNFGPITLINSPFYFISTGDNWEKIEGESDLDVEFGNAYLWFINHINSSYSL